MDSRFDAIKNDILGKKYELSIAFVSPSISKNLNKKWRKKDNATNVLSFALSKTSGELVLCRAVIKKETKKFGRSYDELVGFLVIHGMLHLKGLAHGSIMEKLEQKYDQKYFYRHRRGLGESARGSGRVHQGRKKS